MKKLIILLFICSLSSSLFAQDTLKSRIKEYYLTFADFSPLNLQLKYKRQISKNTFFKIGFINLSANGKSEKTNISTVFPTAYFEYSAGLEIGIEFRKHLNKRFSFYHGPNLSFSYNKNVTKVYNPLIPSYQQKNTSQIYKGSIPYSLGILFNLNTNILVSAELNVSINYSYADNKFGGNSQASSVAQYYNIGFDNRLVLLSIVYRL